MSTAAFTATRAGTAVEPEQDIDKLLGQAEKLVKTFNPSVSTLDSHVRDTIGEVQPVRCHAHTHVHIHIHWQLTFLACCVFRATMTKHLCSSSSMVHNDTRSSSRFADTHAHSSNQQRSSQCSCHHVNTRSSCQASTSTAAPKSSAATTHASCCWHMSPSFDWKS